MCHIPQDYRRLADDRPPRAEPRRDRAWGRARAGGRVKPYYVDPDCVYYVGDVLAVCASLPARSVHTIVTSPPYWSLRSYLPTDHPDKALELGSEKLHDCLGWARGETCSQCYICHMRTVAAALWRVLRDDGTFFLNVGDSYAGNRGTGNSSYCGPKQKTNTGSLLEGKTVPTGLKEKDRVGIPERLALALQSDGWTWRDSIHLCKVAPMPESVTDRTTQAHENLFLFTKRARYYFDAEAVRESQSVGTIERFGNGHAPRITAGSKYADADNLVNAGQSTGSVGVLRNGRNPRSWMLVSPEPSSIQHYATFVGGRTIPSFAIRAGTSEHGVCSECGNPWERVTETTPMEMRRTDWGEKAGNRTATSGTMTKPATSTTLGWRASCQHSGALVIPATIFDPFSGSGTTQVVARELGRRSIYCDLSETYARMAIKRMEHTTPMLPMTAPPARERQQSLLEVQE